MRHLTAAAVLAAATIAVAGCGSSDSSSSTGSSAGTGAATAADAEVAGADVQQAKQDLDAIVGESEQIELPELAAAPPSGKTISYLGCPVAICTEVGDGVKQAAKALGWQVREVQSNLTPAGYKSAWSQIAQNPGDGVVNVASLPDSAVAGSIEKAGVPVVAVTSPSDPGPGTLAVIDSRDAVQRQGAAQASWVVQDAGKPVKSVYIYDPSLQAISSAWNGYQEQMAKVCPDCSVDELKVSAAKIGPALAQDVVSYLQRNPDVGYVSFGLGDLATGVPAAMRSAGLGDKVKVTVRAATPPNFADVKTGAIAAAFTDEAYEAGWRAVDKVLRAMTDTEVGESKPVGKVRLLTQDTLPADISKPYTIPDYQAGFEQAWGIS